MDSLYTYPVPSAPPEPLPYQTGERGPGFVQPFVENPAPEGHPAPIPTAPPEHAVTQVKDGLHPTAKGIHRRIVEVANAVIHKRSLGGARELERELRQCGRDRDILFEMVSEGMATPEYSELFVMNDLREQILSRHQLTEDRGLFDRFIIWVTGDDSFAQNNLRDANEILRRAELV